MRRDLIRILHVPVPIVAANTAREIADALQEDDRLAREEGGERVRYRERCEYEEAVGRDPLQHVDLLTLVAAAEFQLVLAAHPAQRCREIVDIFEGVARAGDRITHRGIAVYLNKWRPSSDIETRRVFKSKVCRQLMVLMLAEEEFVAQERESPHSDDGRRKGVCFLGDKILRALVFAYGEAGYAGAARRWRIDLGELIEHVIEVQRVARIEVVVDLDAELIGIIA